MIKRTQVNLLVPTKFTSQASKCFHLAHFRCEGFIYAFLTFLKFECNHVRGIIAVSDYF